MPRNTFASLFHAKSQQQPVKSDQVSPITSSNPEDDEIPEAIPVGMADEFVYRNLPFIVSPHAKFRAYWDLAIVVALLLVFFLFSFFFSLSWTCHHNLAFECANLSTYTYPTEQKNNRYTATVTVFEVAFLEVSINAIFIINRFVDLLFVSDLILTFMTPYTDPDTLLWVVDHKLIAVRYISHPPFWFFIDAVTCVPFDAIAYAMQNGSNLHALRILRLLRLIRVFKILRGLTITKRWEVETGLKNSTKTLLFFCALMIILSHWVSCFFTLVTQIEARTPVEFNETTYADGGVPPPLAGWNWIVAYFEYDLSMAAGSYNIWSIYLAGYYMAVMTLTTIGYGDVTPKTDGERIYVILVMFLGGAVVSLEELGSAFSFCKCEKGNKIV